MKVNYAKALCLFLYVMTYVRPYDLTVVGPVRFADGIGRQSVELIDTLKDHLSINFIPTTEIKKLDDVPKLVQKIILNQDQRPGKVAILEQSLVYGSAHKFMPDSLIKIAYAMVEGSRVPEAVVDIINNEFDAIAVPSEFLIETYRCSGVKKPIFYLPLGIYLEDFLQKPLKTLSARQPNQPFVFGSTASFVLRKEYFTLVAAFAKEFGNRTDVILKINGRKQANSYFKVLKHYVASLRVNNIHLSERDLSWAEYIDFLSSSDCVVNLSMGEGYSIVPREAMALGVPCVLSNNTGQESLCKTGFVRGVPSTIRVGAKGPIHAGCFLKCALYDVRYALKDVHANYSQWLNKAKAGREWVAQFTWKNLQKKYINLVKPNRVIFGEKNEITNDYLQTNCSTLYKKYLAIRGNGKK